nr:hypothetical protein REQ54_02101 [Rhizobium sp. Q54]
MTRFSEKSFEVRFCAALSAAMMPFNRNPHWFGMTQAQERINGIDTMVRVKGRLYIFQFKAKQNDVFKLDRLQWRCLDKIGRRYPRSTRYVFPEAGDVATAASVQCLLRHSWCVTANSIGRAFRRNADTTLLSLDPSGKVLTKKRPKTAIAGRTACDEFGCFCPKRGSALVYQQHGEGGDLIYFYGGEASDIEGFRYRSLIAVADGGIPFGDLPTDGDATPSIRSSQQFEEILEEEAEKDLSPGLFGLFLPST